MRKMISSLVALTLSGVALTTGVMAQTTPTPDFATVDADKSGGLNATEFASLTAAAPGR